MRTHRTPRSQGIHVVGIVTTVVVLGVGFLVGSPATVRAQSTGVIAGSVTADEGGVRAFHVKARDTVARIAYTVYTVNGLYQIFNVSPSTYEVQVVENGFEELVRTICVTAGNTATVDLALTSTGVVAAGGAAAGSAAGRENYGSRPVNAAGAELVDFDELYRIQPET